MTRQLENTRSQLQELADAYEAYCDEIGQTYYNVDAGKALALYAKVQELKERWDLD